MQNFLVISIFCSKFARFFEVYTNQHYITTGRKRRPN